MTFNGTLEELQARVESLGCVGHWVHQGSFEMLAVEDGVSNLRLNWWPGTGALLLVGDPAQRQELERGLKEALAGRS
ncbi:MULTISPECIES: hypothetical protein [unclassified Cyanobium]|uniref:hypothetical protein n=1 Tax=unclassified Cyanobium TaxID=2627006 RepID=UPI0020CB9BF7|nr:MULTISPECIES: hypothetical protein [unclassified Cyanobium]MCP9857967.1 hypothetical protein [Cyanobium sp. Cruz-8H5]MCP9865418.1 hypothetical protein [Cyanobium sp. Cruz-8D1]